MSSEQTEKSNQGENQIPNDRLPASAVRKRKSSGPVSGEMGAEFQKMLQGDYMDGDSPKPDVSGNSESNIVTGDAFRREDCNGTLDSLQTQSTQLTQLTGATGDIRSTQSKRISDKQRKESLEEYRQAFLTVPKLEDRKPVFISCEVRDRIDGIVRRLGVRGGSVSGFIENLARHHLDMYGEDIEAWRKL